MEKKLNIKDIIDLAKEKELPIKPKPVTIPESVKKFDRVYLSQEHTKKILHMR